ncbi:MAG: hypothetical protein AABM43_09055 [Actinomycetota bacterium]
MRLARGHPASIVGDEVQVVPAHLETLGEVASSGGAPFEYRSVFAEADEALYAAKAAGRNCVRTPERVAEAAHA